MKKPLLLILTIITVSVFSYLPVFSQAQCNLLQANNAATANHAYNAGYWFGVMELPFLFIAVFFAFMTANTMKGGKFGRGMQYMAWGFVVMAVGHLHMQIEHFYGFNLFKFVLGQISGSIAWFIALVLTWGLSGMGFYSIYKAGKGG
jgi:hypothetical protein